jgi:hypothetical protein
MKAIVIDYPERKIILSSAFEKKAYTPRTVEYDRLIEVRHEFPDFKLDTRKFKTNTKQDRHKGLSYDYMRCFIKKYDPDAPAVLAVFEKMVDISKGHSKGKRYPTIKSWFLDRYPDYAEFGMTAEEVQEYRENKSIVSLRRSSSSAASAVSANPLKEAS